MYPCGDTSASIPLPTRYSFSNQVLRGETSPVCGGHVMVDTYGLDTEGYGLGELAIRRTGHREKRVCGKKIVVTLVLVCRVQDDVRVTSKSSSESG